MQSAVTPVPLSASGLPKSASLSSFKDLNPATTLADANENAIQKISDLLRHPDDLNTKLPLLRKKLAVEKAAIDAQLKTLTEAQINNCQGGLDALRNSRNDTDTIKKNMIAIDAMCGDARKAIPNYAKIKKISRTHQNVLSTRQYLNQFQQLERQIQQLRDYLDSDKSNYSGSQDNLLYIHFKLSQLEHFKNDTLTKTVSIAPETLGNLQSFFKKLDILRNDFEGHLWKLAGQILELVKKRQSSVVARLAKIIEVEEKLDELILERQQLQQQKKTGEQQYTLDASLIEATESLARASSKKKTTKSMSVRGMSESAIVGAKGMIASSSGQSLPDKFERNIKSYRSKLFDVLHEAISNYFYGIFQPLNENFLATLDATTFVIEDLQLVFDELSNCFPKKYNMFAFYVAEYHRHIFSTINGFVMGKEDRMEAVDILRLKRWVKDYHADMSSRLGVSEEMLEPRLLDGQEDKLIERYVKLVRNKMNEWMGNLLDTDTKTFMERKEPPEMDPSGMSIMSAPVIMFQMINQQIDIVSVSSRAKLLADVVTECCGALDEYQKSWLRTIESEYAQWLEDSSEISLGLPDYIVAVANDQLRCSEYTETVMKKVENLIDEEYRVKVMEKIQVVMDGFIKVTKRLITMLVDFPMIDCKPAWIKMHVQPEWYEQELMKLILGTLEDYTSDYQSAMNDYLFQKLTTELQDRFLLQYIESTRNKGVKYKTTPVQGGVPLQERFKMDIDKAVEFFARYKSPKRVQAAFDPIEKVVAVILATPRLVFVDFYALWKTYPDVPLWYIEEILRAREDMDKATIKECMETCRKKIAEEKVEVSTGQSGSVFSKLEKIK